MSNGDVQTKAVLRARCREFRSGLRADDYALRSEQIVAHLRVLDEIVNASCIHVFWPMPVRREVDLRPLVGWLYTHKKQIVLPVVVANVTTEEEHLEHRVYAGEDALVRSHLGIDEPLHSAVVPVEQIDVVIAPALGVDRSGNRLGYGRGHYDRFLRTVRAPIVAPLFHECLLDAIPAESHDVPVDILVTELGVLRTGRS